MNTDESSDNEPLKKIAKTNSKAAKKTFSVPPQKSVDSEKEGKIIFSLWIRSINIQLLFSVADTLFFLTSFSYTESLDDEDGSDDEPLSERAKRLYPKRQRKSPGTPSGKATPVIKSKRNAARKEGRCYDIGHEKSIKTLFS